MDPSVARTNNPDHQVDPATAPASVPAPELDNVVPDTDDARLKLFHEFDPFIRRLIGKYADDAEMRKDLRGEIYFRFCKLLDVYDPERGVPLRPYLGRALTTSVYTYARHQWRLRKREVASLSEDYDPTDRVDPTPQWNDRIAQDQFREGLAEAIYALPRRQRQVLILRYYDERSFEDIALALNVRDATARSLLRHALNNLRRQIEQGRLQAI